MTPTKRTLIDVAAEALAWASAIGIVILFAIAVSNQAKAQDAGYYARQSYVASGSSALFAIPFPYLNQSDIHVLLNGTETTDFTFSTTSMIELNSTPVNGTPVVISRLTPIQNAKSVYNGGALSSTALNNNQSQAVYGLQEANDALTAAGQGGGGSGCTGCVTLVGSQTITGVKQFTQPIIAPNFSSTVQGLVPPSGGGTSNFLRADGGWAVPAGSGGGAMTNWYDASGCTVASTTSSADAASCIQAFINSANTAGAGRVWVGAGIRNLKSQLTVKTGVVLECAANGYEYDAHAESYSSKGTIFAVLWGSGSGAGDDKTKAAILINHGARIEHCGFWYPSQSAASASPTEYGSTIQVSDTYANTNQQVIDNWCVNCYNFIDFRGGLSDIGIQNAQVENNRGAPIHYAILVNFLVDWSTFTGNTFNSGGLWIDDPSPTTHLRGWVAAHGGVYYLGKTDWFKSTNDVAWGYSTFADIETSAACCTGFIAHYGPFEFDGDRVDGTSTPIYLGANATAESIRVTGGTFAAFNPYTLAGGAVIANGTGSTLQRLRFSDAYVMLVSDYVVWLGQGSQTIGDVSISGVMATHAATANDAYTISTANSVTIMGSTYTGYAGLLSAGTYTNTPTLIGDFQ